VFYEKGEIDASRNYLKAPVDSVEEFWYSIPQYPPVMDCQYSRAFGLGLLALKEGDVQAAKARLIDLESLRPGIKPMFIDLAKIYRGTLEAEIFIAQNDYEKAIEVLRDSPHWEMPRFSPEFVLPYHSLYLKDILPRAYAHCGEREKAIAEYERLTTIGPSRKLCPLIHPLYHYRLALLYEETGQDARAVERYERFLATWMQAGADRPEIKDAKARLARLKGMIIE